MPVSMIVPPGCVTFACLGDKCFIQYSLTFEVIAHSITALMSLLLAIKLFFINSCKNGTKSNDIKRANRLALIESIIMAIFDIIPAAIQQKYHFQVEELGSVILFSKMCGYSLEGYLVYQTLKRRNETVGASSNGKN
ncbi:hypothetical protein CAEBREN_16273 [Caenorhabditis brenneri]|uniref:Uncharacterized protein n=1 Tax=Caenorhabditis brenneri TaxID=135651 RepID=G0NEG9_CAEBE|nr:hypothetical protein CAEBREN_16273 [Caenorhabditis brenneri]